MANDQYRGGTGRARANGGTDQDYSSAGMDYAGKIGVGNVSLGNFNGFEEGEDLAFFQHLAGRSPPSRGQALRALRHPGMPESPFWPGSGANRRPMSALLQDVP